MDGGVNFSFRIKKSSFDRVHTGASRIKFHFWAHRIMIIYKIPGKTANYNEFKSLTYITGYSSSLYLRINKLKYAKNGYDIAYLYTHSNFVDAEKNLRKEPNLTKKNGDNDIFMLDTVNVWNLMNVDIHLLIFGEAVRMQEFAIIRKNIFPLQM